MRLYLDMVCLVVVTHGGVYKKDCLVAIVVRKYKYLSFSSPYRKSNSYKHPQSFDYSLIKTIRTQTKSSLFSY